MCEARDGHPFGVSRMKWDGLKALKSLELPCKSSGLKRTFEVRVEPVGDEPEWFYYAKCEDDAFADDVLAEKVVFGANIKEIQDEYGKLRQLVHVVNPPEYRGCGLTAALILRVWRTSSTRVVSSSRISETRTCQATGVWKSLEAQQLAAYDPDGDRYYCPKRDTA